MKRKSLRQLAEATLYFQEYVENKEFKFSNTILRALRVRILQELDKREKEKIILEDSQTNKSYIVQKHYHDGDSTQPYVTVKSRTPKLV